jgi:hypothetical protein
MQQKGFMLKIPDDNNLLVNHLSACFNNTSATYKFYWFLSILQSVENGQTIISKRALFARMIANAWYTVNYFKVSFGKQDLIQNAITNIKEIEKITIDENTQKIIDRLSNSNNKSTINSLWHFNKQVPHWFLSPWFPKFKNETDSKQAKRIYKQSNEFESNCLYSLNNETIQLNKLWVTYLQKHVKILKEFCYWNLVLFLQSKNPNVPDIPNKLIKPAKRNNLTRQRTNFWDIVINELGAVQCIYTGRSLTIGNYAVEHFIPYSFVSHDLIWNLIPSDNSFNSTKNNKLPKLEEFFDPFFELQRIAIEIVKVKNPKNRFLEDYLTIFPELYEVGISKEKFKDCLQPLITIASNNGFEYLS